MDMCLYGWAQGAVVIWAVCAKYDLLISFLSSRTAGEFCSPAIWLLITHSVLDLVVWPIVWIALEALLLSRLGWTPGKWLLAISVRRDDGTILSFSGACIRCFRIWLRAYALGIMYIQDIALFIQLIKYYKNKGTSWDRDASLCITTENKLRQRIAFVLLICGILIYLTPPLKSTLEQVQIKQKLAFVYSPIKFFSGVVLLVLDERVKAIEAMQETQRLSPKWSAPVAVSAYIYYCNSDYQRALQNCDMAIQLSPDDYFAYYWRAKTKIKSGELNGALDDLKKCLSLRPDNRDCYQESAKLRQKIGDWQGAREDLRHILQLKNMDTPLNYARLSEQMGDLAGADVSLSKWLAEHPNDAGLYMERSGIRVRLGNPQLAIRDLQTAAELFDKQNRKFAAQECRRRIHELQAK
jgi:tetratricopeptide (TPR) repeat protein